MIRFASLTILIVLLSSGLASSQDSVAAPADESVIAERTEAISETLRCVVCQNQSIADSNAPLAQDMRRLVEARVRAGDTDAEVREYVRSRYGDFVLMRPPFQLNTVLLWFGPLVIVALLLVWYLSRLFSKSKDTGEPRDDAPLTDEERAALEALKSARTSNGASS